MSRSQPISYTTETGVTNPEPPKIEQAISRRVRIMDAQYGLATAAKVAHERVEQEKHFVERLAEIEPQIASLNHALESNTSSNPAKATVLRDKLVAERDRLARKLVHA